MDLISAQVEAAKLSKLKAKKMYIIVDDEGECTVDSTPSKDPENIMGAYVAGNAVTETEEDTEETTGPVVTKALDELGTIAPAVKKKKEKTTRKLAPTKKSVTLQSKKEMKTKTKKVTKAAKKLAPAKKAATKKIAAKGKDTGTTDTRVPRGNNMLLTPAEWKKVDAILEKEGGVSFSAWCRGLVQAKIK